MTSLVDEIQEWVQTLPYWEQVALEKIASGKNVTDEDCKELLDYLLQEKKLVESETPLPELKLSRWSSNGREAPVRLVSISNVQNVNALVPEQKITFGPALTAIFGENGSGKSGYARVLGCVGFTRGDIHILPDIDLPVDKCADPAACIEIDDGKEVRALRLNLGEPVQDLRSFHVFDSTSVIAHIAKSHSFAFTPAALTCLPKLAEVTDRVRSLLDKRIENCAKAQDYARFFSGESKVAVLIRNLPDVDAKELEQLAVITTADTEHRAQLEKKKAELVLQNTAKQLEELGKAVSDMTVLASQLQEVEKTLSDSVVTAITAEITECQRLEDVAHTEGSECFAVHGLAKIGSQEWQSFALHAKALAEVESHNREPYPQPNDRCLLCHQPLTTDAYNLIRNLWVYLQAEAKTALEQANTRLLDQRNKVSTLKLDFFSEQSVAYRQLETHDKRLISHIKAFLDSAERRQADILSIINTRKVKKVTGFTSSQTSAVTALVNHAIDKQRKLKAVSTDEESEVLENALRLLDHRDTLKVHLSDIKEYIHKRRWAKRAKGCGGSTRHITTKYNEMFERLVTGRYIDLFTKTLERLDCPMRVGITTKGEKSRVLKQIALRVSDSASKNTPSPDKVLSEGEKRAVALADFLTEVTLDEYSCGIVIDDPVTSLDHQWKSTIARVLTEEAKQHQVIVFTHDLYFLWMLNECAESESTSMLIHWVKRGDTDGKPGYVYLNNSPSLERHYKTTKIAREWLEKAKKAEPQEQEYLLKQGFGALRTTYEAFVIHDLLQGIVTRWGERVTVEGKLENVALLNGHIATTVVKKGGELSRFIEGHSHSDTVQKPSIGALQEEIDAFDKLKAEHKAILKSATKN